MRTSRSRATSRSSAAFSTAELPEPPQGYWLKVAADGRWELNAFTKTLAAGTVPFAADRWHKLSLRFVGPKITVAIDGVEVKTIEDWIYFDGGMAGLGSGVNHACSTTSRYGKSPARRGSTLRLEREGPRRAIGKPPDSPPTATSPPSGNRPIGKKRDAGWKSILAGPPDSTACAVRQAGVRIEKYKIQYHDGAEWQDAYSGVATEHCWSAGFPPVEASRVRLYVVSTRNDMRGGRGVRGL